MIIFWPILGAILAFTSVLLHAVVTRRLNPNDAKTSIQAFWFGLVIRLVLIAVFFWQLVQQEPIILIATLVVFMTVYAGSLYFIIKMKPQWFQTEAKDIKKESPLWMQ